MENNMEICLKKMIINGKCVNECVVLITGEKEQEITVEFIDIFTKKSVAVYEYDSTEKLVDGIALLFERKKIKAVILNVFKLERTSGFENNVEFCKALIVEFDMFFIPYCFLSSYNFNLNKIIVGINVLLNPGENILLINIFDDHFALGELSFSKYGYEYTDLPMITDIPDNLIPQVLHDVMLDQCKPTKIVLLAESSNLPWMKRMQEEIFKPFSEKLIILEGPLDQYSPKSCVEIAKWVYDRDEIDFHSTIKSARKYCIKIIYGPNKSKIILHVKKGKSLPFHESVVLPCLPFDFYFGYYDQDPHDFITLQTFKLEPPAHGYKISLSVDSNNVPSYKLYNFTLAEINYLNDRLDMELESKIPVITLLDNLTFISAYNGEEYEFLKNWSEYLGEELFVSFDEKRPKFGEDAVEIYKTKPSSVVFDIITVLAQSLGRIRIDKAWGFTIKRDETNQILFEFDYHDGTRRKCHPKFLLCLLIRRHIKAIEFECGKAPTAICFHFIDPYGKEVVKEYLEEACESLKIECSFLEDN